MARGGALSFPHLPPKLLQSLEGAALVPAPEVLLRLMRAVEDEGCSLADIADIVDKDPAITIPDGEYSLSSMTHQVELESSGHFPMIDESLRFNRLLTDFLALDSGISPRELQLKEEWRRRVR